ncbi:SAM-dependent methyltransferase [Paenibacillus durus ATCC 35681]|uniref:SAM-dependent methyltransferase n=1 Tax=Paenibacillus durus ATCC 35681 TaxID=1333534 RepID=A0A0F7F7L6_PAEDU|nr:SAM-dependent methyltransferase [Paenibacillus durus ATCC 35681]
MKEVFKQVPLYRFLYFCNEVNLDRVVLDCGAGGETPPLSLFSEFGYSTFGIEYDIKQMKLAGEYAKAKNQELNITQGDMRKLPFGDKTMSFVYSYNSVFHMTKAEVELSIAEMKRVLKPGGLLFVNFLTTHDFRCGQGVKVGDNQYEQFDDDLPVIHSYYKEGEPDPLFSEMDTLYKEDRVLERIYNGEKIRQGFVDYILQKN